MTDAQRWQQQLLDAISDPQWQTHHAFPPQALAVYRNNYRVGLMEMLALVYPILRQLVGEDFFSGLSRDFVRATPSRSGNLHRYGAELAQFLRQFPPAAALPYLPDVATLEWALHRGYYAADSATLEIATLAAIPPPQWGELRLTLHPANHLLHSAWALSAIHAFHQPGAARTPFPLAQTENLLLWRQQGVMQLRRLDPAPSAWLQALQQGQTLDQATSAALAVDTAFDLQTLLLTSLQDGWFSAETGALP